MKTRNIIIKQSKINKKGIFNLYKINKNKKIFVFANRIIKINHKLGCNCIICCKSINLKSNLWLYPKNNSYGYYLNHSCNPNSFSKGKFIYALKNIKPNTEITIDYSTTNIDKKWKMNCSCKQKNCRKIIKSIQYLPNNLFKKYYNFTQPFIRNNYNNL